jgi:hypothetical protein
MGLSTPKTGRHHLVGMENRKIGFTIYEDHISNISGQ